MTFGNMTEMHLDEVQPGDLMFTGLGLDKVLAVNPGNDDVHLSIQLEGAQQPFIAPGNKRVTVVRGGSL